MAAVLGAVALLVVIVMSVAPERLSLPLQPQHSIIAIRIPPHEALQPPPSQATLPVPSARPRTREPTSALSPSSPQPDLSFLTALPPVCADSPLLRVVHRWAEQVQQRAVVAPRNFSWIYYSEHAVRDSVTKHTSGGLGDRLIGIVDTLLLAVETGRALGVEWFSPVHLQVALTSTALVPWALAPNIESLKTDAKSKIYCAHAWHDCQSAFRAALELQERVLRVAFNVDFVSGVTSDSVFAAHAARMFGVKASPQTTLAHEFSCLFRALFQPAGHALELVQRADALLGASNLTCVQLRMGSSGQQDWVDSEAFLSMQQLPALARKTVELLGRSGYLLATSDSAAALEAFLRQGGFPYVANARYRSHAHLRRPERVLQVDALAGAVHIDRAPADQAVAGFGAVIAQFVLLARCDHAIVTERSGFGRLGVWLRSPPSVASMRNAFFTAMRQSQVALGKPYLVQFCDLTDNECAS